VLSWIQFTLIRALYRIYFDCITHGKHAGAIIFRYWQFHLTHNAMKEVLDCDISCGIGNQFRCTGLLFLIVKTCFTSDSGWYPME